MLRVDIIEGYISEEVREKWWIYDVVCSGRSCLRDLLTLERGSAPSG